MACACCCASSDLPPPVAALDVPRHLTTPQSLDPAAGSFRLTRFRRSAAVGLVHLSKVCCVLCCVVLCGDVVLVC